MLVQRNYTEEKVIESYTITGVTRADMYKMTQVCDKVMGIIGNHLDKKAEKKEYLNIDFSNILPPCTDIRRCNFHIIL